jgi:hypothetical protein
MRDVQEARRANSHDELRTDGEVMVLIGLLPRVPVEAESEVKPEREGLLETLQLASVFALVTFVLHVAVNLCAQHIGYGLFRDEMYYIVCGRHLAWGYVDQPPMVALAARFSELGLTGAVSLAAFSCGGTGGGWNRTAGAGDGRSPGGADAGNDRRHDLPGCTRN